MKSKKWLWGLLGLIILIVVGFGIYEGYSYFHPNVYLSYRVQEGEDLYLSLPSYAIETTSRFGYAPKYDEEMKEWWLVTNEMEVRLHTD